MVTVHGGNVPADLTALMKLPGVGRYTASAVLCFCHRRDVALVDGNIIRILDRVFSIRSRKSRPHEDLALWAVAAELVPSGKATVYKSGATRPVGGDLQAEKSEVRAVSGVGVLRTRQHAITASRATWGPRDPKANAPDRLTLDVRLVNGTVSAVTAAAL